ncbi:MAG: DUF4296 domain-containing protein [Flavobacteriaceae bacterium]|nr:DUF4296 domain-containing protein [Flavobacteriaceae bacterium]
MKKLFVLIGFLVLSCDTNSAVTKPDVFLSSEKMENILYDLTVLKAIKTSYNNHEGKALFNDNYIYRKYNIDSTILAQNQLYYAQSPKESIVLYKRVDQRLKKAKDSIDQLLKKQAELKDSIVEQVF